MTDEVLLAPVVLFAYARLDHLQQTIESLQRNPEAAASALHVYCDGPPNDQVKLRTDAVRTYVDSLQGFASVTRVYRNTNLGLAKSIISGVTELLSQHPTVIVMEDDLVVSSHFLGFMNSALSCYKDDVRVASIHGYCYPTQEALPETFFMKGADCWGWATWARAWAQFEPDGRRLLQQLRQRKLSYDFDLDGSYPFTRMLRGQIAGRNDSWAIRWHASCYLANMLTLYPGRTLVENIGHDDSGTHCAPTNVYSSPLEMKPVLIHRIALQPSLAGRLSFINFFRANKENLFRKVMRHMSKRLKHFL